MSNRILTVLLLALPGCASVGAIEHHLVKVGTPIAFLPKGLKERHYNPKAKASYFTRTEMQTPGFTGPVYYSAGSVRMQRVTMKDGAVAQVEVVKGNPWSEMSMWYERTLMEAEAREE